MNDIRILRNYVELSSIKHEYTIYILNYIIELLLKPYYRLVLSWTSWTSNQISLNTGNVGSKLDILHVLEMNDISVFVIDSAQNEVAYSYLNCFEIL